MVSAPVSIPEVKVVQSGGSSLQPWTHIPLPPSCAPVHPDSCGHCWYLDETCEDFLPHLLLTQNTTRWGLSAWPPHSGYCVGGFLGKGHLERHPKFCTQHLRYHSVEVLVVKPNLRTLPLYFYAGSLHDLWIPILATFLTEDAFQVMDPRVSKSKVFNLLLISQLPK